MKFFWAVLVCTLLSAAVVLIQSFRLEHNNFDGVAASPAVIDFGTVHNVNSIQKVFNIFNGSDSEVEIVDIRPSCGCATIGLPQRTIPPHKSIPVTITLDLQGTFGVKEFAVSLITNHPATPAVRLLLSGTITVTDLAGTLPFDIGVFAPNETIDKIIPLKQTLVNPSVKITKVSNKELELPHSGQQGEFADTAEIRFYEDSKPIMLKTEIKASFL